MILNLSESDYANYSHNNANALRSVGQECIDLALQPHGFSYQSQSAIVGLKNLESYVKMASVVQVMHSSTTIFSHIKKHAQGKILIYHTGTRYRTNHKKLNKIFKNHTSVSDHTEFDHLGEHHYVITPVEVQKYKPCASFPIRIGHYPSNPEVKGSNDILRMLSQFAGEFSLCHSVKNVPHYKQIERITDCDVYIELFKPVLWGQNYGCFGVTALEAAAMGKVVITQDMNPEVYKRFYGKHPFLLANTEIDFINIIDQILTKGPKFVIKQQAEAVRIMKKNHSFEATGKRILKIIENAR